MTTTSLFRDHRSSRSAWVAVVVSAVVGLACGDGEDGGSGGAGGLTGAGGYGGIEPGNCASDPLETGLVAVQTGVSVDIADCSILAWTASYGEPDPMIVKAMIYGESRFDYAATGCPNLPCGIPDGWTEQEARCYGMMQVVPACGPIAGGAGLLPSGHPNLELDPSAPGFPSSVYNPDVNIHIGVAGFAGNRAEVEELYPGCTEDQYTLMALGNLASHGSTTGCDQINRDYIDYILPAYFEYCSAAGYAPHAY